MKAKTKFFIFIFAAIFAVLLYFLLNNSFLIIRFWTGCEIILGYLASVFIAFWVGRWTHPHEPKSKV